DGRVLQFGSDGSWRGGAPYAGWQEGALREDGLVPVRVLGEHGMAPWGTARRSALRLPPVPYLRRAFQVRKPVSRALLYGSALGLVDFHLNGRRVSEELFTPGWTDYHQRVPYRCWDVTAAVRAGDNTLGAQLADGWYSGYVGWGRRRDHYGTQPRMRCVLRLEHVDGTVTEVASDSSWQARPGPVLEADFLMGERYDARAELPGWCAPDGGARDGWQPVVAGAEMEPRLVWHQGPPVVQVGEFAPVGRTEPQPGVHVFDLGRNFAGVARIRVQAPRGTELKLRFAERLDPDGSLYVTNLRGARAIDSYVCKGGGVEVWEPRFTFHGFQYVELSGLPERPADDAVTGLAFSSDTPLAGSFACSSEMLNQLASNVLWTQRANFIDVPTDCPQRDERLGWTGDAQAYVATATLWCDVQPFFRKWLQDLSDAQRADGQLPTVAPLIVSGSDGGPGWSDAGTIVPWEIYQRYGDLALLRRQYPTMLRYVEFCRARSTDELLPPAQFHCFGDWVAIDAPTPHEVIYVAYYARSVELTARAAEVLGEAEDAARLWELHGRLRLAFQEQFVDAEGRVRGDTQCAYVLPLAYDLLDGAQVEQAAAHLVRRIEDRRWHLSTGFLGTKELMLVLSKIGREDVAWRLMMNDSFPSWGFSIRHGATSIWERWDGWTPERGFQDPGMNSFAHYSFGAVYQWMVENIGGIRPLAPGYARVEIAPRPGGGVSWADTGYESVRGRIATSWRLADGAFHLEVEIPANTTAEVLVPTADPASLRESGRPLDAAGLRVLESGADGVRVAVPSGTWRFTAAARG
ncbi:MAG: family 78 glycoside hydrolase catalytic domain, partial [Planctomycetes bacterium]|nr:family 78 glycoside hydrolase catalytic domain [Planctomycetota bacterium]